MANRRLDRRQGFLISATVHLIFMSLLFRTTQTTVPERVAAAAVPPPPEVASRRAVLVTPGELQRLLRQVPSQAEPTITSDREREPLVALPPAAPLREAPTPVPPPPPRTARDRASIGSHADSAAKLELRRDTELGSRGGRPGDPGPLATPPPPGAARSTEGPDALTAPAIAATLGGPGPGGEGAGAEVKGRGLEPEAQQGGGGPLSGRGEAGQRSASGPDQRRSIRGSLAELDRRLGQMGDLGHAGVAGIQVGSIFFDPRGADFTAWINHFKNEVYRNWIVPEAARFGFAGGQVDFEFWVERDGRLTGLRLLQSSGTRSLDRAARNGLTGSRLLPLPDDYGPDRVRFQVSFSYGEARG